MAGDGREPDADDGLQDDGASGRTAPRLLARALREIYGDSVGDGDRPRAAPADRPDESRRDEDPPPAPGGDGR